ncbi:MAG: hypothetical protein IH955_04990 [Chloroflexi bacterium]|nr:hypothetical protein [Chloroflexota bacterium]
MLAIYKIEIERPLSSLFRDSFGRVTEAMGFKTVMELAAPDTGVWKYQKDDFIVSLHTYSAPKQSESLVIESHTYDLTPLISATLKDLLVSQLAVLLDPMDGATRNEIEQGLNTLLAGLGLPETEV